MATQEAADAGAIGRPGWIDWLFRNRRTGRLTIAQAPNLSIGIFLACTVARWLVDPAGDVRAVLVWGGRLALVWWSVDEILRGVNPWRRILGGVVLVGTVGGAVLGR